MTSIEKLPQAWCHAWNDEPELARGLVNDDARMWNGRSDMFDGVVGPDAFVAAVTGYREGTAPASPHEPSSSTARPDRHYLRRHAPRRHPLTGADVSTLRDGRVV